MEVTGGIDTFDSALSISLIAFPIPLTSCSSLSTSLVLPFFSNTPKTFPMATCCRRDRSQTSDEWVGSLKLLLENLSSVACSISRIAVGLQQTLLIAVASRALAVDGRSGPATPPKPPRNMSADIGLTWQVHRNVTMSGVLDDITG